MRPPIRTRRKSRTGGGAALVWLGVLLALGAGVAAYALVPGLRGGERGAAAQEGAPVRRGPLRIAVTASGGLRAAETTRLTSGVEGRTTILSLVPEGTQVRAGDVVCELDATTMAEQRIQQSITTSNAEAELIKGRQTLEIQRSQNRSDINKALQALDFARQDLQMFLEGERSLELEQAQQAIELAKEEAQRARSKLTWSERLAEKGFLTSTELEADRIAAHRADVTLQQATQALDLLQRFKLPRREAELRGALEEAQQESERVELQAKARLVDFEANVRSCEATLALEQEKLARLDAQIEKAKLRAPRDGYVVYAQRDHDETPIQEGVEVYERQEILSIPSTDGMVAEVKLHESVLKQVQEGQPCVIKVDALSETLLRGRVDFVAMLPDQNMRWTNPNTRVYRADIGIATPNPALRPGMSCSVEILIEELADAVYVPVQTVFRERQKNVVFVVRQGQVERREVQVGRFNELWVQVLDGLAEGEVVLLDAPLGMSAEPLAAEAHDAD